MAASQAGIQLPPGRILPRLAHSDRAELSCEVTGCVRWVVSTPPLTQLISQA